MPRLPPPLLRHAATCSLHLLRLLRECRDLESASNELRWLTAHASRDQLHRVNRKAANARLTQYVYRRSRGEPLQYILGNQPFGELEILCRPNVLIPRPETELYTTTIADRLKELDREGKLSVEHPQIRIADLCTGSGCIALLLHALLRPCSLTAQQGPTLDILGVDISSHALKLARDNLEHNLRSGALDVSCAGEVTFEHLDVLKVGEEARRALDTRADNHSKFSSATRIFLSKTWDVIVSNPPYISSSDYAPGGTVGRSVRDHEPKLALVPPSKTKATCQKAVNQADQFYEAILYTARLVQPKLLVMEIGDAGQADRVRTMTARMLPRRILVETWGDDGCVDRCPTKTQMQRPAGGATLAHERAVVVWTGTWMEWRLRDRDRR